MSATVRSGTGRDVVVAPSQLLEQLRADAAAQAPDWIVTGNITGAADAPRLNVEMEHPASHGLIFAVNDSTDDPREWLQRAIEESEEIAIVNGAPSPRAPPTRAGDEEPDPSLRLVVE